MRVFALILASPLFFIVSCSSGSWFIGDALSRWQAAKNPTRYVRAVIATKEGEFQYVESQSEVDRMEELLREYQATYEEFGAYIDDAEYPYSFLLPVSEGRIDIDDLRHVRFEVNAINDEQQEITVWDIDDDYRIQIIYRAEQTQITPVYSRIFGVGHVMGAWPYAFVLSLIIYGIGRSLKKRQSRAAESSRP